MNFYNNFNLKFLIADDDIRVCQAIKTRLSHYNCDVITASDGEEALFIFKKEQPDIIILDVMLTKIDGYKVCNEIRKNSKIPIILLTALGNINDRIVGLESGADEYIIKPVTIHELEFRIHCLLRRVYGLNTSSLKKQERILQIGNLKIQTEKKLIFRNNNQLKLTAIEYSLLEILVNNAGQPLTRENILSSVWGYTPERFNDIRIVDVHIFRLRSKLEKDPSNPELIITARRKGYMFQNIGN